MMKQLRSIVFLLLVMLVALPLAAQDGEALLRSTMTGDISTLNPVLITDGASGDISEFIWADLYTIDKDSGLPIPDLASWQISEDGLTYTFTIRDDANWSDGTPITSADALFTYNAIIADAVPAPDKGQVALIASVNAVDDKTFEIVMSEVDCTVWGGAFAALNWLLPAHMYAADYSDFVDNPINTEPQVTSGPYHVEEWAPDEFIRLAPNPNYYGGAPQIDIVFNRVLVDTTVINQALLTGEVDTAFMYMDQFEQLGGAEELVPYTSLNNNAPMLMMNWANPDNPQAAYDEDGNPIEQEPNQFFSDVRVRQAIAMGYDKEAIMLTLGEGGGFPLSGPVTAKFAWALDPEQTGWSYDPERAAELLDEAGWLMNEETGIREKDGVPFEVDLVYSPLVDLWTNIALVAQDQLGQLGLKFNVESMEWSAYLSEVLLPQKYDATIVGFGGGSEVDGIAWSILLSENDYPDGGFNIASYVNPRIDELLKQGRTIPGCDVDARAAIYQEIQRIAIEDVAYDFTVGTTAVWVMNSRVTGYEPGEWNQYWNIPGWGIAD